jgi:uroporphyrinogen decarboxylase
MPDTHKERLLRALSFEPVDRLPVQIHYTTGMGAKMADHFHVPFDRLPFFLDNHLLRVDVSYPKKISEDGKVVFDWWGAGHDRGEEGYYIRISPLEDTKDLDSYPWPDPNSQDLLVDAQKVIQEYGGEYFIVPNFGFALFERAWSLRGFENLFADIALEPAFVADLMDRITEIQLRLIHRFIELGVDGAYFGDDYGAQKGLLISPASWRQLIKPRLARMFAPFVERGLPVLMHSDGQIQKILPDLVEIGLTTLNPVQPEVLDHTWLKDNFAGKLSFYGGLSTQTVLPQGTPDEVVASTRKCIEDLAVDGTGLLLAPSHRMMTDIPMENVEAMLGIFKQTQGW